jgi:tetratricopeptide (TPR) repeat protein
MKMQLRFKTALLLAGVLSLVAAACKKQPVTVRSTPPPVLKTPTDRELGDRSFLKRDFRLAVEAYRRHLDADPEASDRDITLLRLAISLAMLSTLEKRLTLPDSVLTEIKDSPESPHAAEAELLLLLDSEIRELRGTLADQEREVERLSASLETFWERENRRRELEIAELSFARGDYESAVLVYSRFLDNYPEAEERDRVLFHLAMAHALPSSPLYSPGEAEDLLKRLVENSKGPYAAEAEQVLRLTAQIRRLRAENLGKNDEIERLSAELEKLKAIDLKKGSGLTPR